MVVANYPGQLLRNETILQNAVGRGNSAYARPMIRTRYVYVKIPPITILVKKVKGFVVHSKYTD